MSDTFAVNAKKQEKKSKCFPSVAKVMLENGTSVRMSELQAGDKVQTGMNQ